MTTVEVRSKTGPRPVIPNNNHDLFSRLAGWTIRVTGGRWGFFCALATIIIWALLGPYTHYSENWQLVINTGTTIVTFLMVFLIQNAQNRESKAIHLKLDELILAVRHARNELIDIENLSEAQLDRIAQRYKTVAARQRHERET
jgi:low affinity Fe/Cu permease